jgi:XRE family transcriptional regulator, regulator of sulfur utilization
MRPNHRRILGETIRLYRQHAELSQEKLAEFADLNPKYLSEVERGRKNVSVDALGRLAKALKVSIHDLTKGI